jgi:enamine deaminase RidA (YjgF/YER057c/UK114 family)
MVFLSGQAAMDPVTELPVHAGDIVAQTEYIYRNLIVVLEEAGLGPEHFVRTTEFVTPNGATHYRDTPPIRRQLLREPYPASTAVLCHSLLRREFDIEIVSVAYAP